MKNLTFIAILIFFSLTSCEEVIDLELNSAEPKLVVEASINYYPEPNVTEFPKIKLSLTAPYFNNVIPAVTDAEVNITDEIGNIYPFIHDENGWYYGEFEPKGNIRYTLEIVYKNEIYTATTQLINSVPIEFVEQKNDGGFLGEDIELKAYFTDPPGERNFYFFEGISLKGNVYDALSDEFFDGNLIFGFYSNEDLEPGDVVTFRLYGINERNYNYIFTLLQQGDAPAGPFETQPATVRGNIVNQTNPDNFPLGYFRISEVYHFYYTVQ
jgi:hypothetical protein